MATYFLTGATGFVGGHLADQLLETGHDLVVIARNPGDAKDLTERGAEVLKGDVTEKESMREPRRGVDGATYLGDNSKAQRELGLGHRPLASGLAETVAAEQEQLAE